jgi:histidinol-phosphate aminotransferase
MPLGCGRIALHNRRYAKMPSVSTSVTPENLLRQEVLALHAYHAPAGTGMLKLDAMENPYPLPRALSEEIARLVVDAPINRYPDASARNLKEAIRAVSALPPGMEVLLGNGSDEIIQLLAMAVNKPGAVLLGVEPSFVMYKMIAAFTGMQYVGVPLREDFSLDLQAVLDAVRRHRPALVFLAYPNNPTGNLFEAEAIEQIIAATPGLVVVDEAYYAFTDASFMPKLAQFPNLLVMRTFSKLGMAGLRLGFLVGAKRWVEQLEKLRLPYNVGVLPQLVAEILLQHHGVLEQQAAQIRQDRTWLYERLVGTVDVRTYPSEANFILFRVRHAGKVFEGLKQRGILIKNLHGAHPALDHCLRVTVGTPEQNDQFVTALQESIHQG